MLFSMTGYGRATHSHAGKTYTVEIRSLNSKQNDLRLRTSQHLHKYEMELRRLVLGQVKRGKLEVTVDIVDETGGGGVKINTALLNQLYTDLLEGLAKENDGGLKIVLGGSGSKQASHENGIYAALLRIPGIVETGSNRLEDEDWAQLKIAANNAVVHLNEYRTQEGEVMAKDLAASANGIAGLLTDVAQYEDARVESVRTRMEKHLKDYLGRGNVDKNRYEQEILFYLEKMDINEEKVRLKQNCEYFLEILNNKDTVKGRKLVVNMKEHLEMIKEQLANVA